MDLNELVSELKDQEDVDFVVELSKDGTVRLVKIRRLVTILTNWVEPEALENYINDRIDSLNR